MILVLAALTLASVAIAAPRQARALRGEGVRASVAMAAWPAAVLAAVALLAGALAAPRVGLRAPFFEAWAGPGSGWLALRAQLPPGLLGALVAATGALGLYYGVFRPRLPAAEVLRFERARIRMGVLARVLQGGVVEEVVFRWGATSLLAWLAWIVARGLAPVSAPAGSVAPGGAPAVVMWLGIALAALLFGLAHLPSAAALGIRRTPALAATAVTVNGWLGLVCGWLFWRHGLAAAMLAHGGLHALWAPLDRAAYRRLARRVRGTGDVLRGGDGG